MTSGGDWTTILGSSVSSASDRKFVRLLLLFALLIGDVASIGIRNACCGALSFADAEVIFDCASA
jgi:hypothetical protein